MLMKNLFPVEKLKEFDDHKCVIPLLDAKSGLRGFIAIHRSHLQNPSFGATRFWPYNTEIEALQDALKLSRAMSYKAALAGLKHGGAKGIIWAQKHQEKNQVLEAYLQRVNLLGGNFITGADIGISPENLLLMRRKSPYIVGLKADAPKFTALGLYYSLQVCLKEVFGTEDLKERTFAIQGLGKIGTSLLEMIYRQSRQIWVADVDQKRVALLKKQFPRIKAVAPNEIYLQKADVFSPCALAGVLNNKTIPRLRCQIVVGGANNQLADPRAGEQLRKQEILYSPDYVVNAGGLISVVDEFENKKYSSRRIAAKVFKIRQKLKEIINESKKRREATNLIADEMAQKVVESFV
ncbi:MAG: Glu/Leu/Phe/Val dehydrogenase dimerization domain-containing protein [bacterium]|nr:Glu/Leu/Phe/Val dehydrogenase dimerization domain-containing protein [bacterium]